MKFLNKITIMAIAIVIALAGFAAIAPQASAAVYRLNIYPVAPKPVVVQNIYQVQPYNQYGVRPAKATRVEVVPYQNFWNMLRYRR